MSPWWMMFAISFFAISLFAACSADDHNVKSVEVEVQSKTDSVVPKTRGKGEPVYSTSFAIRLAELTLQERGVECAMRSVSVSYCEGIYTVTFARPETDYKARDYVVAIAADSSRIVSVNTGR